MDISAVIAPYLNSAVVRRFDGQGNLIGSFLPQSSLTSIHNLLPGHGTFLAANGDAVAWYSAGESRYVEISSHGITLDARGIRVPASHLELSGLCVTSSGRVFLSAPDAAGHTTLSELDKTNKNWLPVAINSGAFLGLYGARNEELATMTNDRFVIRFLTISE